MKDITISQLALQTDLLRYQVLGLEQVNARFQREISELHAANTQL
jgi:hypothetical protein